jgi:MerR family transcriptional regulator, light-induced transcriptional regulator
MDHKIYQTFLSLLDKEDKDQTVSYILTMLESNEITLKEIYDELLRPSLVGFTCKEQDEDICIWKEHIRSSIVRTILECTYPYVMKEKAKQNQLQKKIIVVCPREEFHEIGAIIVTHYMNLAGFDAMFIGANTPNDQIVSAIPAFHPDYIAFSVTNFYNIVATKIVTDAITSLYPHIKIIVGGQAFQEPSSLKTVKHHYYFGSSDDVFSLAKEVADEISTSNRN